MFDLKAIRENPESFDAAWARRGLEPQTPTLLEKDVLIRKVKTMVQEAEAARNKASKQIGAAMREGDKETAEKLKAEVAGAKNVIAALGAQLESEQEVLNGILASLPNTPADDVPDGAGEEDNVEIATWGEPKTFDFEPKAHDDLGEALGLMDFETAAKMSGSRFVILRGGLSRMDRALAAMMLDMQTGEGFEETSPPLLVWPEAMFGTGQLPKFAEDSYQTYRLEKKTGSGPEGKFTIDDFLHNRATHYVFPADDLNPGEGGNLPSGDWSFSTKNMSEIILGHFLVPTAEVALTNIVRESILDADILPKRMTAHTPCFRSEAGSAGRDTKGMIRQHQFNKVELVSIASPEQSHDEHKTMLSCAEKVLQALDLPYRVVELCTGDLGFGAKKTYDIEVWLPSQQTYREISSISNCGDFQARRMNARYRAGEKDNRFVHTLNGSGLAVGRTLVAVLENYQNEDGSITVPDALVGYMGGVARIG